MANPSGPGNKGQSPRPGTRPGHMTRQQMAQLARQRATTAGATGTWTNSQQQTPTTPPIAQQKTAGRSQQSSTQKQRAIQMMRHQARRQQQPQQPPVQPQQPQQQQQAPVQPQQQQTPVQPQQQQQQQSAPFVATGYSLAFKVEENKKAAALAAVVALLSQTPGSGALKSVQRPGGSVIVIYPGEAWDAGQLEALAQKLKDEQITLMDLDAEEKAGGLVPPTGGTNDDVTQKMAAFYDPSKDDLALRKNKKSDNPLWPVNPSENFAPLPDALRNTPVQPAPALYSGNSPSPKLDRLVEFGLGGVASLAAKALLVKFGVAGALMTLPAWGSAALFGAAAGVASGLVREAWRSRHGVAPNAAPRWKRYAKAALWGASFGAIGGEVFHYGAQMLDGLVPETMSQVRDFFGFSDGHAVSHTSHGGPGPSQVNPQDLAKALQPDQYYGGDHFKDVVHQAIIDGHATPAQAQMHWADVAYKAGLEHNTALQHEALTKAYEAVVSGDLTHAHSHAVSHLANQVVNDYDKLILHQGGGVHHGAGGGSHHHGGGHHGWTAQDETRYLNLREELAHNPYGTPGYAEHLRSLSDADLIKETSAGSLTPEQIAGDPDAARASYIHGLSDKDLAAYTKANLYAMNHGGVMPDQAPVTHVAGTPDPSAAQDGFVRPDVTGLYSQDAAPASAPAPAPGGAATGAQPRVASLRGLKP